MYNKCTKNFQVCLFSLCYCLLNANAGHGVRGLVMADDDAKESEKTAFLRQSIPLPSTFSGTSGWVHHHLPQQKAFCLAFAKHICGVLYMPYFG